MTLRAVRPPHETRTRILDVAEELFMHHGFEATSMRMLTAAASVNLAAVNYHFGSKDALVGLRARRDAIWARLKASASTPESSWDAYTTEVDATLSAIERDTNAAL